MGNLCRRRESPRGEALAQRRNAPAPIPDAENFAAVPIFAQLFKPGATDGPSIEIFKFPRLYRSKPVTTASLEDWRNLLVEEKWLASDAPDATPAAILRVLDERFGADWEQLREAATRPHSRFPVQWEKIFTVTVSHLSPLQSAARICALRAEAHFAQGNGLAGYEDLQLHLRLGTALDKEPTTICWLGSNFVFYLAIDSIRKGIAAHAWDDATLTRIDADLAKLAPLVRYKWAMESERGILNDGCALAQAADRNSLETIIASLTGIGRSDLIPSTLSKSWLYRNQLRSNEYVDEMLARIDAASWRYIPTPLGQSLLSPEPRRLERLNYALFYEVMPLYSTMENVALFTHTRVQCARTAVALERWRLARGAYPEALAALVPGLLSVVPHDVIDGQPLRYRRTEEGGYLLYSIGIDAKDHGGIGPKPGRSEKDAPDWVWKP